MKTSTSISLISANIDKDSNSKGIPLPLDDKYILICDRYAVSRVNAITFTPTITKKAIASFSATGALTVTAEGNISYNSCSDFIDLLAQLSARTEAFTLTVGTETYENMILAEFCSDIDKYRVSSKCRLKFIQI